ncbi:MAG: PIN domain-containing protein [Alphaproteobacteria bacterium]|jgi:predicted nucleic acid-binding protein|nr:PIN domain-containing protein [Alphaproteobacteria bacterium]
MWLLDTSALLKVTFNEPGADQLDAMLIGRADLAVSRLAMIEAIAATRKAQREERLSEEDAELILDVWLGEHIDDLHVLPLNDEIAAATVRLIREIAPLPLRAADALHIQTALHHQAVRFVTADRQQANAARFLGLDTFGVTPA